MLGAVDKRALAEFLRHRRERLLPAHVGLPAGGRRRTPGLRRDEVAHLAAISVEYYTRLEQARGPHPSSRVLSGIGRALRLSREERTHLFHLAGESPTPPAAPSREVPPSIAALLDRLPDAAAMVLDATYTVLAWNALLGALLVDFAPLPPSERNLFRRYFLSASSHDRKFHLVGEHDFGPFAVAQLRAATARYPRDPSVRSLIDDLYAGSHEFRQLWDTHRVRVSYHQRKTMAHPTLGTVELNCDVLLVHDQDQHVVIFTADPGSPSERVLGRLSAVG